MMCWAYIFHADALRQWNRLDEALDLALQGVRLSEQTETIVALYLGYTILMRIYLARGEMDAARFAFQQAEVALVKTYSPYRRDAYLIVNWVQFWLASGELERAMNWVEEIAQHTSVHSPLAHEREDVARARILLAQKMPTEALLLLEALQVSAETGEGLEELRARVAERFAERFEPVRLLLPYDEGGKLNELYALGAPIEEREDTQDGVLVLARLPRREIRRFASYVVNDAA